MKTKAIRLLACVFLFGSLISRSAADTAAGISVDWRGLPNVEGVLRDNSKASYGFVNFVAFGPGWAFTAQDYAAKEHKKERTSDPKFGEGLLFTGKIWAGGTGLSIREEFYDVSGGGGANAHVRWTISNLDSGKPMNLERAYVRFPLSREEFAGGRAGGNELPKDFGNEWIGVGAKDKVEIVSADGSKKLLLSIKSGNPVVQDARKDKQDRFELRVEFPDCKTASSSTIEFDVSGAFADSLKRGAGKVKLDIPPPPAKLSAGDDWCVFPYTNDIQPGSILDFSKMTRHDAPAGRFGFARVTPDGHFAFERNPEPVRFVGGNLCFDANFPSKEECRRVVDDFVKRGWNTVRFHHIDVTITKDEWNKLWERTTYPEISPEKLDMLDYLMSEFKKAGIYATFDLYAMGGLGSCEGFDKPLNSNTIKAIVPIHKPAEDQWFRRAMEIFDHVNPYTGVKWKDEPAVLFVTLLNEDSIASVWWGAADVYVSKYLEWAKSKGYPAYDKKDIGSKKEFAEFLHEVKAEANRRMTKRLKDAGVHALVSGGNWWDTMAQTYEREALEVVDNHGYGDHPQPSYQKLPFHINQSPDIKGGNAAYCEPVMKAPSRVFGKPFTVTEYNFCPPNRFRGDGGLAMGAYAALQDWDALYRFAWSHARAALTGTHHVSGFDIARDPIGQLTERQIVLMFGRGDVSPAEKSYAYGVCAHEAFGKGLGDMWSKNLFPHAFTQLGFTSRIGSFVCDGGKTPALACDKTWTEATRAEIPKYSGKAVSDTGEIRIDTNVGRMTVNTPKTAAVCAVDKADLSAGPLSVSGATTFCSVSASSMDGRNLVDSGRILFMHITDVLNDEAVFTNSNRTDTKSWGKLPYLAKTGSAKISLANSNAGLSVWALASDGRRLRRIPAVYENGKYSFTVSVAAGDGANAPTMLYEIAR